MQSMMTVLLLLFCGLLSGCHRRAPGNTAPKMKSAKDSLETSRRIAGERVLSECDSIMSLYGNPEVYRARLAKIESKMHVDYSEQELGRERAAVGAFEECRKKLSRLHAHPSGKSKTSSLPALDSCFRAVRECYFASTAQYVWMYTCKAADLFDSTRQRLLNATSAPVDTLYRSLQKQIHATFDSLPQIESVRRIDHEHKERDPYYRTPFFNPWMKLEKLALIVDSAAAWEPRLYKMYQEGDYPAMVRLLRSGDTRMHGYFPVHTLGLVFFTYAVIDSLLLNRYEGEIRAALSEGDASSVDSLLLRLENNNDFLFPHQALRRKREIKRFLANREYTLPPETAAGATDSRSPAFSCFYSAVFNRSDECRPKEDLSEWLCLAPKGNHYGFEQVTKAVLSSKDYFKVHPEAEDDDYSHGSRIAYIDGNELPADDESPYIFFVNVDGVRPGPVVKAEVYNRSDDCIAFTGSDSLAFRSGLGGLHFTGVAVQDTFLTLRMKECSHYFMWIGDINHNGRIDCILESFGSQAGNICYFLEKGHKDSSDVLTTLMTHSIYSAD